MIRELFVLGSKDYHFPRIVCCWKHVSEYSFYNYSFCKVKQIVYSLLQWENGNVCTLSSLRWMNYGLLVATCYVVYWLMKILNPANVWLRMSIYI